MHPFNEQFGCRILKQGHHHNVEYAVVMGPYTINGYVLLPHRHPWEDMDYLDMPAEIHGGITYHEGNVIGFDTNHPDSPRYPEAKNYPSLMAGHVWKLDEVADETRRLAAQVASSTPSKGGCTCQTTPH